MSLKENKLSATFTSDKIYNFINQEQISVEDLKYVNKIFKHNVTDTRPKKGTDHLHYVLGLCSSQLFVAPSLLVSLFQICFIHVRNIRVHMLENRS